MNFHAHAHVHVDDASVQRRDPTGTTPVRNRFQRDLDKRWNALRRLAMEAIAKNDILGLGGPTVETIRHSSQQSPHAPLPTADKVRGFQSWIDEAMRQVVLGKDGAWTKPYIDSAARMAQMRAEDLTGRQTIVSATRVRDLASLTVVELQGVIEAVSQQAVRVVAHDLMANTRPNKIARDVAARIDKIGRTRGRMLAAYMVVKTFNSATLDAFRSLGIKKVGTVAERLRIKKGPHGKTLADAWIADAARKTKQKRHGGTGRFVPYTPFPSQREYEKIIEREARLSQMELVEVLTAGDELVCQVCEDISDEGPYSIDEAESLIPAHPDCRCAFVPAQDERFAEDDEWNEADHPRVPAGQPGGGEFGSGGGGGGSQKSQRERIAGMLRRGTTTSEILRVTGWPSVSVPQQAHASGLHLERYRENGVMKYRGTPYTPEQRAARQAEINARAAGRAARTPAPADTPRPSALPPVPPRDPIGRPAAAPPPPAAPRPAGTNLSEQPSRPVGQARPAAPTPEQITRQSQEVLERFRQNTGGRSMTRLESGHEVIRAAVQLGHGHQAASAAMSEPTRTAMVHQFGSIEHAHGTVAAREPLTPRPVAAPKPESGKKEIKAEDFAKAGIQTSGPTKGIAQLWNEKIPMSPDEFKKSFLGPTPVKDFTISSSGNTLRVNGTITDERGRGIGTFTRGIDFADKMADSSYFKLNDDIRGGGIGKTFLAANVQTYKQLGLEGVRVHANIDVGGYAWARYGYVPEASSWDNLRTSMSRTLDRMDDPSKDQLKEILKSRDPKMMWVIADHELGKKLLLNSNWYGTIKFNDRNTMRRFDAYVHKQK